MAQQPSPAQLQVAACERTFRRYGLPLLIDNNSVRRDVFGRSAPLLLLLMLVGSISDQWTTGQNVAVSVGTTAVSVGAAAVIAAGYAVANLLRGRPWHALPQDIGPPQLAFFVLAPAVPPLLAGWYWGTALTTVALNLLTLVAIWSVMRYGVHATLWWGMRGGLREFGSSLLRLIRFLPLLLVFAIALFFTIEVWQVFDHTPGMSDLILGAVFSVLILAILRIRLASETSSILSAAEGATESGHAEPDGAASPPILELSPAQLVNVKVMIFSNQLLQVLTVSFALGLFFFALGTLTITEGVMQAWGVDGGSWLVRLPIEGTDLVMSQTLLRVSVALATLTGLYYAISVLTDALYRDDFIEDMSAKIRDVEAHRHRYATALAQLRAEKGPTP